MKLNFKFQKPQLLNQRTTQLNKGERKALRTRKSNSEINLKNADKGTMTVIMNKSDKIQEGQAQLEDTDCYQPLDQPMVVETANKVAALIQELYDGKFIDDKTLEWLQQTPNHRAYQNFTHSQTNNCRLTDYFGMRLPDRKNFGICRQTPTAYCSIAEIVHQRYHRLHQF